MPPRVVLPDAALGVDRKADVDAPFKFGVGAKQHVHAEEALHFHYHRVLKRPCYGRSSYYTGRHGNNMTILRRV